MPRTRIKICGITRRQDALAAAHAGADAIGVVLHANSKRRITLDQAHEILGGLPPFVSAIGLFVDAPPELIREAAAKLPLTAVQLHGRESAQMVAALTPLNVIKVIHVNANTLGDELRQWKESRLPNLSGLLLDTAAGGGSGIANDFDAIESRLSQINRADCPPIILAGGLTPLTVGQIIRRLRPWAVDVSSGVETRPGEKSAALIHEFVAAVRDAEAAGASS